LSAVILSYYLIVDFVKAQVIFKIDGCLRILIQDFSLTYFVVRNKKI